MLSVLHPQASSPPSRSFSDSHRQSHTAPASSPTQAASSSRPTSPVTPSSLSAKEWRASVGLINDVQFVPAKTASVLGGGIEGKFKPISDSDMELSDTDPSSPIPSAKGKGKGKAADDEQPPLAFSPSARSFPSHGAASSVGAGPSTPSRKKSVSIVQELHSEPIPTQWPGPLVLGRGLANVGNTCFLNSVLQCLLYTPPLLHMLMGHKDCPLPPTAFCMVCSLRRVAHMSFNKQTGYFNPSGINQKLPLFAKGMRRGRQEDAHEFLRQLIDSLQKTCLAHLPPKERLNHTLAETSWVHKIFGGKTRSRVTCKRCGHNSDTFEACLDLSLDLPGSHSIEQALRSFVGVESLGGEGKDRYKCEKCNIPVDAEKQFTIHSAPMVLTMHLKRFTPMGRKIGLPITYKEHLNLANYVSEGEYGPRYSLYGVICHSGSGPHSGHYYAYIKSPQNRWHEMNDEDVSPGRAPPLDLRSAYILFYIQDGQSRLQNAISWKTTPHKKLRVVTDDEDGGEEKEEGPARPDDVVMGGPEIAAAAAREQDRLSKGSQSLQQKILAATTGKMPLVVRATKPPLRPMVDYSDHDEDLGEKIVGDEEEEEGLPKKAVIGPQLPAGWSSSSKPKPLGPSESSMLASSVSAINIMGPIPTSSFYGAATTSSNKRSSPATASSDTESSDRPKKQKKRDRERNFDPRRTYGSLASNGLHAKRADGDGDRKYGAGGSSSSVKNGMRPKLKRSLM